MADNRLSFLNKNGSPAPAGLCHFRVVNCTNAALQGRTAMQIEKHDKRHRETGRWFQLANLAR
jgi:hypothetical protein